MGDDKSVNVFGWMFVSYGLNSVRNVRQTRHAPAMIDGDRDDIDPPFAIGRERVRFQVGIRQVDKAGLFCAPNRLLGSASRVAAPRAHFHKHQHRAVTRNKIELATGAAPLAFHDRVALARQVACRRLLAKVAKFLAIVRH